MRKVITSKNYEKDFAKKVEFDAVKKCPLCHTTFNGEVMESALAPFEYNAGTYEGRKREECLYVLHYCQACSFGFLGIYSKDSDSCYEDSPYTLVTAVPQKCEPLQLDFEISKISPAFVSIYEEAHAAEQSNLTTICGMGYRKALEFLTKDYLISRFPDDAQAIVTETLAQSINRIDNPKIKILAERSAWLGNDETHYVKKHKNCNHEDIKSLLEAMVTLISYENTVEKALLIPRL